MMLIIVKDNQITAIEKTLLKQLNIDLSSISDLINSINLQLSAIESTPLRINNYSFNVTEIELLSTENIKVFNLIEETSEKPFEEPIIKEEPEEITEEEKRLESADIFAPKIETTSEPDLDINLIKEESSDDFLIIPQEEPKHEEENTLDISLVPHEEPEETEEEKQEPEDKLIAVEEEHIEFEQPKEEADIQELSLPQSDVIEISFEDDLEEIRKILSMNKTEFNNTIINELKKASEELGIEYNELTNWYEQLIDQIKDEKADIYKFINKKEYNNLHESYHKLKGAALNLRLSNIALVLKKLDELSKNKEDIEKIKKITDDFYKLIENDTVNLTEEKQEEKPAANKPDKFIEDIILKTIQTYLSTQNEAQFQKDKKYIEKLLNTKIDSIEDLQRIIKGM